MGEGEREETVRQGEGWKRGKRGRGRKEMTKTSETVNGRQWESEKNVKIVKKRQWQRDGE